MVFHLDRPYPLHPVLPIIPKCDNLTAGARGDLVRIAAVSVAHEDEEDVGQRPPPGIGVMYEYADSPVGVVFVAASGFRGSAKVTAMDLDLT